MDDLWQLYISKTWVEPFLIYSIALFVITAIILFTLIMISRTNKIRNEKLEKQYEAIIEKILFPVLFNEDSYKTVKKDAQFDSLITNALFRNLLLSSIINLHQNYDGIYAKKLEAFYFESNLINDSFAKLKSRKWEVRCKGIKELGEMNISKAFNSLVKISRTSNKTLRITALNACIKLNGTNGILHLIEHKDPIDLWTQLNILLTFKKGNIEDTAGIERLLSSKNPTVVSLGLKLIQTLYLSQNTPFIIELIDRTKNNQLKKEAQNVLQLFLTPNASTL